MAFFLAKLESRLWNFYLLTIFGKFGSIVGADVSDEKGLMLLTAIGKLGSAAGADVGWRLGFTRRGGSGLVDTEHLV